MCVLPNSRKLLSDSIRLAAALAEKSAARRSRNRFFKQLPERDRLCKIAAYPRKSIWQKTFHMGFRIPYSVVKERRGRVSPGFPDSGGDNRDRTGDLSLAKAALSQLSYIP